MLSIAIGVGVIVVDRRDRSGHVQAGRFGWPKTGWRALTGNASLRKTRSKTSSSGILARPAAIDLGRPSFWTRLIPNAENINLLYEQADVGFSFNRFMVFVAGLGVAGAIFGAGLRLPTLDPAAGGLPLGALAVFLARCRRKKRISKFVETMPEAVELVSRALRAGHGLASGLHLVAEEMKGPIADEFNRVFEEQNLGIPIELALRNMADRIPVMDVRFFVIAVVVQRSTGGDLAEVLDKIGRLIRQRFELHGHVKSLTAEGRLSGVILLGLPPSLLGFLYFVNYDYISALFNTPTGVKMLSITAFGQVIGAWVIKKIVAIKV